MINIFKQIESLKKKSRQHKEYKKSTEDMIAETMAREIRSQIDKEIIASIRELATSINDNKHI